MILRLSALMSETSSEPLYRIPSREKKAATVMTAAKPVTGTAAEGVEKVYPKPGAEDLEAFKGQLDEWVRAEEHLRKLNIARRECMLRMKKLGESVEHFMTTFGYEHINRKDGSKIKYRVREVKRPVTLQAVKLQLMSFSEDDFKGCTPTELLERLFNRDNRETVVRTSLRRFVPTLPTLSEL